MRRRRQKVAVRRKVLVRRLAGSGAAAALLVLGVLAALTVRHTVKRFPGWRVLADRAASMELVLEGVPADQEPAVLAYLERSPGLSPEEAVRMLSAHFPIYRAIVPRRDWLSRKIRLSFEPLRAVARARILGREAGHLSEEGTVFSCPPAWLTDELPVIELAGATADEKAAAAKALTGILKGPLAGTLESLARGATSEEGWEAKLKDGTRVLWGDLRWTDEKSARLREVLDDAGAPGKHLTADLRHFEDGRILVRAVP